MPIAALVAGFHPCSCRGLGLGRAARPLAARRERQAGFVKLVRSSVTSSPLPVPVVVKFVVGAVLLLLSFHRASSPALPRQTLQVPDLRSFTIPRRDCHARRRVIRRSSRHQVGVASPSSRSRPRALLARSLSGVRDFSFQPPLLTSWASRLDRPPAAVPADLTPSSIPKVSICARGHAW